jgi:hypothetical protein
MLALQQTEGSSRRYVPGAHFPPSQTVLLTGAAAFGVDFIDKDYGDFPWLILAVLVLSYCCCCARSARWSCRPRRSS